MVGITIIHNLLSRTGMKNYFFILQQPQTDTVFVLLPENDISFLKSVHACSPKIHAQNHREVLGRFAGRGSAMKETGIMSLFL